MSLRRGQTRLSEAPLPLPQRVDFKSRLLLGAERKCTRSSLTFEKGVPRPEASALGSSGHLAAGLVWRGGGWVERGGAGWGTEWIGDKCPA